MIRKVVILASVMSLLSLPAMAQVVCSERGKSLDRLATGYKESPVAMGLASNGSVLEVLAFTDGTWTIIVTTPAGRSCVVASGEAWEEVPRSWSAHPRPKPPGEGFQRGENRAACDTISGSECVGVPRLWRAGALMCEGGNPARSSTLGTRLR